MKINGTGNLETDSHKFAQLSFEKGRKQFNGRKGRLLNKWYLEQLNIHRLKKKKRKKTLNPYLTFYIRINSKWIVNLTVVSKTTKLFLKEKL